MLSNLRICVPRIPFLAPHREVHRRRHRRRQAVRCNRL